VHDKVKEFHCSHATTNKSLLELHINVRHTKIKNYTSELCGYSSSFPGNLKRHKDVHLGTKKHVCSVCGEAFGQRTQVAFHMKKHRDTHSRHCAKWTWSEIIFHVTSDPNPQLL
jgi:KRAB domain-containing zinc finger protein